MVATDGEAVISSADHVEKAAAQPEAEQPETENAQPSQEGEAGGEGSSVQEEVQQAPAGEASQQVEGGDDVDAAKETDKDGDVTGEKKVVEVADEVEEKEEAGGISFPIGRVKRIMRKNPDKKKNFGVPSVHAVATVAVLALALKPNFPGTSPHQHPLLRPTRQGP